MFKNKKSNTQNARQKPSDKVAAPVFSYYSNRSQSSTETAPAPRSKSPETPKKNHNNTLLGYLPAIFSFVLVLLAFTYVTTLNTDPRIVISAAGSANVAVQQPKVYQQAATDILKSSISNRSKITINTDKIAAQMQQKFPELGDMAVTVPLISRRPIITIQPATPALILIGPQKSFVVDSNGRAVLKAGQLNSGASDK